MNQGKKIYSLVLYLLHLRITLKRRNHDKCRINFHFKRYDPLNNYIDMDFFDGTYLSSCHKPCLSTKVIFYMFCYLKTFQLLFQILGSFIEMVILENNQTIFDFTFDQSVIISESFYPDPSLTRLLAEVGGSLGLWLGVGIIQLCIQAGSFARNRSLWMNFT